MGNSDQELCASCWDYALRRLRQTFFARHSFHASKSVLINRIGVDKVFKDQGPLSFSGAEEIWIKKRGRAGANLSGWPSMVGGGLFSLWSTHLDWKLPLSSPSSALPGHKQLFQPQTNHCKFKKKKKRYWSMRPKNGQITNQLTLSLWLIVMIISACGHQ